MRTRMTTLTVLLSTLALALAGSVAPDRSPSRAGAQDATAAAGDAAPLEGVTFELLGGGEPVAAPGQTLAFVRMTVDPGGFIGAHGHPGAQIWYVEAGSFSTAVLEGTLRITRAADGGTPGPTETLVAGDEATLSSGDSAFFDADVVHTLGQEGTEPVVVLIPALLETGQEPIIFHAAHD